MSTTIARTPFFLSTAVYLLIASASSPKVRPSTPDGVTIVGVSLSTTPMKPTFTPPTRRISYGRKSVFPVSSSVTLAAR